MNQKRMNENIGEKKATYTKTISFTIEEPDMVEKHKNVLAQKIGYETDHQILFGPCQVQVMKVYCPGGNIEKVSGLWDGLECGVWHHYGSFELERIKKKSHTHKPEKGNVRDPDAEIDDKPPETHVVEHWFGIVSARWSEEKNPVIAHRKFVDKQCKWFLMYANPETIEEWTDIWYNPVLEKLVKTAANMAMMEQSDFYETVEKAVEKMTKTMNDINEKVNDLGRRQTMYDNEIIAVKDKCEELSTIHINLRNEMEIEANKEEPDKVPRRSKGTGSSKKDTGKSSA